MPIAIDVLDAKGKSVYSNDIPGIEPALAAVPYIPPAATSTGSTTRCSPTGKPKSVKVKVGAERRAPSRASCRRSRSPQPKLEGDPVSGIEATGNVVNRTGEDQERLLLYAVAPQGRQGRRGRARRDRTPEGGHETAALRHLLHRRPEAAPSRSEPVPDPARLRGRIGGAHGGRQTQQAQVLGEQGEPCQECGAPLAADQRYCLNCGRRRAGPRVDYRQLMARAASGEPAATEQPTGAERPAPTAASRRSRARLRAARRGRRDRRARPDAPGRRPDRQGQQLTTASAPAPIVKVGGEAARRRAQAGRAEGDGGDGEAGRAGRSKAATGAKAVDGGLTGSAARNSEATVQASTDDLEEPQQRRAAKATRTRSRNCPTKSPRPGAPPPIDKSKAPGGGGRRKRSNEVRRE